MGKTRLAYIDCLRGLSMIFVVYHHLLGMTLVDAPKSSAAMFILSFRMPLFFFISGYVAYRVHACWNWNEVRSLQVKKLRGQLLPTLVVMSFFAFTRDVSIPVGLAYNYYHYGYWFTFASFNIFLIYSLIMWLTNRLPQFVQLAALVVAWPLIGFFYSGHGHLPEGLKCLLTLGPMYTYYPFFVMGLLTRRYFHRIRPLLDNRYAVSALFLLMVVASFALPGSPTGRLQAPPRIACIFAVFYAYRDFLQQGGLFSRALALVGRHTLEIYFIHYFLLFRMPVLEDFLIRHADNVSFLGGNAYGLLELLTVFPIAILLSFLCIGIRKLLDAFPLVSELCFGPAPAPRPAKQTA